MMCRNVCNVCHVSCVPGTLRPCDMMIDYVNKIYILLNYYGFTNVYILGHE